MSNQQQTKAGQAFVQQVHGFLKQGFKAQQEVDTAVESALEAKQGEPEQEQEEDEEEYSREDIEDYVAQQLKIGQSDSGGFCGC